MRARARLPSIEPSAVVVSVDDSGAGIADPEAVLARGITGGRSTGLGLDIGLDIAGQAACAASGSLSISRSRSLGGAAVTLRLPLASP